MIADEKKKEILAYGADNILAIVEEQIQLTKKGNTYWSVCPFPGHDEKTPSFSVSPERKSCYCQGCKQGGDAAKFLMLRNGISFPEALRQIANRAGIEIQAAGTSKEEKEKKAMYDLMAIAGRFFIDSLQKNQNGGKAYVEKRLTAEQVATHGIGYAQNTNKALIAFLAEKKVSLVLAEKVGLIRKDEKVQMTDVFWGRVMFPINDPQGRTIGFGGRRITDGPLKYLNSPETPLFKKSLVLYGLDKALPAIKASKEAFVVEGYTDQLALFHSGQQNVVATCGTAFTKDHAILLKRFGVEKVSFMFDSDQAGLKALERSIKIAFGAELRSSACLLPEGEDPDSWVKKGGQIESINTVSGLEYLQSAGLEMSQTMKQLLRLERLERGMLYFAQNIPEVAKVLGRRGKLEELFNPEMSKYIDEAIGLHQ